MKIAILNDTHCGCRNSSDIFMDYQERFYSEEFFPYLKEHGITQILHLGDYYDNRKTINLKALNHNRQIFLDKLREYNMHMDIIPGNHDVYFKNTIELNSLKELMGHYINEVDILMDPIVRDYGGVKFGLVPWICPENEKEILTFLDNCGADVIGGHFELAGFEMDKGIVCHTGMDPKPLERFETVLSGHFHTKSSKGNITYLGSQMEFFWNDAHDPKYFHIYDTETREMTPVQNKVTLFHKIYYNENTINYFEDMSYLNGKFVKLIVSNRSDMQKFERYVDKIQSQKIHELKIAEDFKEFRGENVSDSDITIDDTETLVYNYIQEVETDLDKERIKAVVSELMIEAQSVEIA
jgi:DNA repair exonuclease SbcCD nuclease subunit